MSCSAFGGSEDAALDEKKRHDKVFDAYEAAYNKYSRERAQLLDWIETNAVVAAQVKQNFTNTDYAFKLYNQTHPGKPIARLKEPKFSDFHQPGKQQKKGKLFLGALSLWATPLFVSFEHRSTYCDRRQASRDMLQSRRLLERNHR